MPTTRIGVVILLGAMALPPLSAKPSRECIESKAPTTHAYETLATNPAVSPQVSTAYNGFEVYVSRDDALRYLHGHETDWARQLAHRIEEVDSLRLDVKAQGVAGLVDRQSIFMFADALERGVAGVMEADSLVRVNSVTVDRWSNCMSGSGRVFTAPDGRAVLSVHDIIV